MDNPTASDITKYLSTETYFDLMKLPYPSTQQGVIDKFVEDGLIVKNRGYAITNLGALLFAKLLKDFESIERKSVRVIVYRVKTKFKPNVNKLAQRVMLWGLRDKWIGLTVNFLQTRK
jgi:ATP-dependent DNA helicase RecG